MSSNQNEDSDRDLRLQKSEERKLRAAMKTFRPEPTARFYVLIDRMPWRQPVNLDPAHPSKTGIFRGARRLALSGALIAVLLLLLFVLSPGGRAAAQRLALFFEQMDSDRTPVQVTLGPSGGAPQFTLSLAEAESLAGFQFRLPAVLPPALTLQGAAFDERTESASLEYRIEGTNEVLRLTQRRTGEGPDVARIGISAEVEIVAIGDQTGEYVTGAWRLPAVQESLEDVTIVELEANWDPDANIQLLRWQRGEYQFELLHVGGRLGGTGELDKAALLSLAASIP